MAGQDPKNRHEQSEEELRLQRELREKSQGSDRAPFNQKPPRPDPRPLDSNELDSGDDE